MNSDCMTRIKRADIVNRNFVKHSGSVRTVIPLPNIGRKRYTASDWSGPGG